MSEQSLFKQNYRKTKNRENLAPYKSAPKKIRSIPHRPKTIGRLHHSPHRSLTIVSNKKKKTFIQNKQTRNTTIKNSKQNGGEETMDTS